MRVACRLTLSGEVVFSGASLSGVADRLVALEEFWAGGSGQLNPPRRSRINPA